MRKEKRTMLSGTNWSKKKKKWQKKKLCISGERWHFLYNKLLVHVTCTPGIMVIKIRLSAACLKAYARVCGALFLLFARRNARLINTFFFVYNTREFSLWMSERARALALSVKIIRIVYIFHHHTHLNHSNLIYDYTKK